MEFSPWLFMLPLGALAVLAASLKLARSSSMTAASAAIGLVLFLACFLLNFQPVYLAVDILLGGRNVTYLLVQLSFVFAMFSMKVAFLPGARLSGRSAWTHLDTWLVLAVAVAITVLWLVSDTPITAYRVDPYRAQWSVSAYMQLVNVYSAACGLLIVRQARHLFAAPGQTRTRRMGVAALMAGFAIGVFTAVQRLALHGLALAEPSPTTSAIGTIDGALVVGSTFLIIVGFGLAFAGHRRVLGGEQKGENAAA